MNKEFSHPIFRNSSKEIRACGRFTAEEVRALLGPKGVDVRTLGCPEVVFLRVLEGRAAFRAGRPAPALVRSAAQFKTDADRKAHAWRVAAAIEADNLRAWEEKKAHDALPSCLR